ncbi:leucine-rich repeat domain-containing protein [Clostridium estertheticum]|uniref:leucine-rich repeat domain-containing protein n=1 Tax=Clostridium estertheticum TaxID=238834 RepID=UPI001C0B3FA3|nr:leucine-rich repeat domain-containing protein [Clostridium estertheticum]MBU3075232.1 leucine-rich repeat domain-containing protein [Clostridium estertheticum]MBU3165447.1 leucine-rich repeat domain-containing protein [Clostridium estertheticum]
MNCKQCGEILSEDGKVCPSCGTNEDIKNLQTLNDDSEDKINNSKNYILIFKKIIFNKITIAVLIFLIISSVVVIGKLKVLNNDNIESKPVQQNNLIGTNHNRNLDKAVRDKDVIIFPDKNLEKVVRGAIKKYDGDILKGDVVKIKELKASNTNISNLSGIQNLTELTLLYLYNNKIENIDDLKGLTKLNVLDLYNNKIENINALKKLTNLTTLYLWNNKIDNIDSLNGLTSLTVLDLWGNKINNIDALKRLTNLTVLDLSNNKINNINSLKGFTKLNALYLGINPITDYSITSSYYSDLEDKDFILQ